MHRALCTVCVPGTQYKGSYSTVYSTQYSTFEQNDRRHDSVLLGRSVDEAFFYRPPGSRRKRETKVRAVPRLIASFMQPLSPLRLHAPEAAWIDVVQDLIAWGVALVDFRAATAQLEDGPTPDESIPAAAFASTAAALDFLGQVQDPSTFCTEIQESADSAHITGYHRASSLSARYNAYREGFVFSDGNEIAVAGYPNFPSNCAALYNLLHETSDAVLSAICQQLELPETWFQEQLGPTRSNSQWHIKRYVLPPNACNVECCLLPTHTDPSLISIVVHHRTGIQLGAAGLQYSTPDREWLEVPCSGHAVAIVLVGSVLQHVTGGYFSACKHRVVSTKKTDQDRMAATLFVRPAPTALLSLPPSPVLVGRTTVKSNLTFEQWNRKTARNYEKAKERRKQEQLLR
jgi:isopenicillin N synthase-like dioxygenase